MTVIRSDGLEWTAPRDGLAHANPHDHTFRALCGALPTSPRFAWPIRVRCAVCATLAAGRKGVAIARR